MRRWQSSQSRKRVLQRGLRNAALPYQPRLFEPNNTGSRSPRYSRSSVVNYRFTRSLDPVGPLLCGQMNSVSKAAFELEIERRGSLESPSRPNPTEAIGLSIRSWVMLVPHRLG